MFTGLCGSCRHHGWIQSGRGSRFLRCELSFEDPAFSRYPTLPVLACPGYVSEEQSGSGDTDPGPAEES